MCPLRFRHRRRADCPTPRDAEADSGPDQDEAEQKAVLHAHAPRHPLQQADLGPRAGRRHRRGRKARTRRAEPRPQRAASRRSRWTKYRSPKNAACTNESPIRSAPSAPSMAGDQKEEVGARKRASGAAPPAVPERGQFGLSLSRMKGDRQLADLEAAPRRPYHHLGGELHPRRLETKHRQDFASEARRPHHVSRTGSGRAD